jgi:hypothetical protein
MANQVDFGALGIVEFPQDWTEEQLRSHIKTNGSSLRDKLIRRNQEANLAEAEVEAGTDTGMEMLGSAAGSVLEGLSRTIGSSLKTANRALNFASGWYEPDLVETPVGRQALATEETPAQSMARVNSGPGIELGTAIEEGAASIAPTLPASRNRFWTGDVPQGLGNVAGMVGVGMVGGPVAGVMSGFGAEADDAFTAELQRQQESGEDPSMDKAMLKSLGYASVASAIEGGLGAGRIIRKFRSAFGGKTTEETLANAVKKGVSSSLVADLFKGAAKEGAAGFSEEALQRLAQDLIVQGKPDVGGMVREGAAGGVVQALVGIPADVRSRMNPRRAVTTQVAVNAEQAGMPKTANVIADMEIATEQMDAPDIAVEDVAAFETDPQTDAVMSAADEARKAAVAAQEILTQEVTETPAPTPANEPAPAAQPDTGVGTSTDQPSAEQLRQAPPEPGLPTSTDGPISVLDGQGGERTDVGGGTTVPGPDAAVVGTDTGTGSSTVGELAPAVPEQPTVGGVVPEQGAAGGNQRTDPVRPGVQAGNGPAQSAEQSEPVLPGEIRQAVSPGVAEAEVIPPDRAISSSYFIKKRKYTPAAQATDGSIYTADDHPLASYKITDSGKTVKARGYVTQSGQFLSLMDVAKQEINEKEDAAKAKVVTAPEVVQPAAEPVVNEAAPVVTPTEPEATPQAPPPVEAVAPKVEEAQALSVPASTPVPTVAAVKKVKKESPKAKAFETQATEKAKQQAPLMAPKAQKAYLLEEVDKAIKESPSNDEPGGSNSVPESLKGAPDDRSERAYAANVAKFGTVTIAVPGDGTFTILNTKPALKAFKERAKKFPVTAASVPNKSANARTTASTILAVGKKTKETVTKAAARFVTDDPDRIVLTGIWSDGEQTVATNGRMMLIVDEGIGGSKKSPQLLTPDGKPVMRSPPVNPKTKIATGPAEAVEGSSYPAWKQVVPDSKDRFTVAEKVNTERLISVIRQAQQGVEENVGSFRMHRNVDGTVGIEVVGPTELPNPKKSSSEGSVQSYRHNMQPGSKLIGIFNPDFVLDSVEALRSLGNETIKIESSTGGMPAFIFSGKGARAVVMPMDSSKMGMEPISQKDIQEQDKVLAALDKAIKATDPRGKAFDVVSGVSHVVANTILKAVRAAYVGGKAMTAAIRDAIAEYRAANPTATFDDNALSDWLASNIGTSEGPTTTKRGNVEDTVQSRPVLNEATALDSRQTAEAAFAEAGLKVNREDGNNLFTPDTAFEQEIAGRKLLAVARRRIREAREQDRPERTAVLIDSLRQNFATSPAFSEGLRTELAILGQSEASSRGRALGALALNARELGGIARDINGELYRQLSSDFNGEGIATVMDSVMSKFRDLFTPDEIRGIAKKAVRMMGLMDRINLPVEDVVKDVMESPIGTKENTAKAFSAAIQKRRPISPALADKMGTVLADLFWSKFRSAKKKALTEVNQELKPEDRKELGLTSAAGKAIKETIDEGGIDTSDVLKKLGEKKGIKPPSDAWVKEFQDLAEEERRLRRLTEQDKANGVTQAEKDAMTIGERAEIIRKMRAMWARLTRPLRWNKSNIAHAVNEYVSANLLARPSFGTKQVIDVATQMFYYTPTRAIAEAVQRYQSDKASGRESRLWKDVSSSVKDAYAQRTKAFQMALAQAKEASKGRAEKEVVAGIQTGVMALERMTAYADKLDAEGKHAQAFVVRAASMVKLSFRFASALDNLQGTLAEQQEMRAQVETELREQGKTPAEAKSKANEIMGDHAAEYALAQAVVGNNPDVTEENRAAAAWNVVRARQYQRMDLAGVPADAFREINQQLRETIGWNQKETAGPGGIVGNFVSGISEYAASLGIPLPVARFGNAIATGINRGLTFAGGGWFPAAFEGSPWYATPKDRTQRKIEAATGMALGASLISLVLSGVVKVFTRWPDDKEERDLWERDGHRPNTIELDMGEGRFLRVSMSVGPMAVVRPFLSAAGEVSRALEKRRKANERSAKAAGKKGAEFTPVELDANEILNIAAFAAWNSIMQGRTTGGLIGGSTFEGKFDVKKSAVSMVSPLIPFQPLERELGNLAGANIDPKTATFTDLLFPTPWSEGNKLNFLGDPVGTGKDQDRIISILTGGTTISGGKESEKAYRLVKDTGWTPPTVNPSQYLTFGADMRQMTKDELKQFNMVRAKTLKERLNAIDESDRIEPQMETALKVATSQAKQAIGAR